MEAELRRQPRPGRRSARVWRPLARKVRVLADPVELDVVEAGVNGVV